MIEIQWIPLNDVISQDKQRYNTNNQWENDEPPTDYLDVLERTTTSAWINQFHGPNFNRKFELDLCTPATYWIKNAVRAGVHTGKFPHLFDEERDNLAWHIESMYPDIFDGTPYFVRSEHVSLKYGQHGAGPYTRMANILESLVTCIDGHNPIRRKTDKLTLYFLPWLNMEPMKEYRGFVHNNHLVALSQQNLYSIWSTSDAKQRIYTRAEKEVILSSEATTILRYFNETIRDKLNTLTSYTFDIVLLEPSDTLPPRVKKDPIPYFIETNTFGAQYSAGSALFGWTQDHDILHCVDAGTKHTKLVVRATE